MRAILQYKALVMVVKRMSLLKAEDPHIIQPHILSIKWHSFTVSSNLSYSTSDLDNLATIML